MRYGVRFFNQAGEWFSTATVPARYLPGDEVARLLRSEIIKHEARFTFPITWKIFESGCDVTDTTIKLIAFYFPTDIRFNSLAGNIPQPAPAAPLDPFDQSFTTQYALAKRIGDSRYGSECQHEKGPGGYCIKCLRSVR